MVEERRIAGFDGLRALAFLLVFASHKLPLPHRDAYGDTGVYTFFVLSGFLITRILARSREEVEAGRTGVGLALARFYLRRSARIFPAYYGLLGVVLLVSLFAPMPDLWGALTVSYLTYTTNLFVAAHGFWPGDFGPLWSLAVEEQFYLLFAPLVLLSPRRWTARLCLAVIALAVVVKLGLEASGASPNAVNVNSLVNFGLLGLGGLVGLSLARPAPAWLLRGWAQLTVAACLLAFPVFFGEHTEAYLTYAKFTNLIAAVLIFQIARGQGTGFVAALEWTPLRLLGRVSYVAYLTHHFMHFQVLQQMLGPAAAGVQVPFALQVAVELALTIALAALSWIYFERPILAWAQRASARRPFALRPAAAAAGAT